MSWKPFVLSFPTFNFLLVFLIQLFKWTSRLKQYFMDQNFLKLIVYFRWNIAFSMFENLSWSCKTIKFLSIISNIISHTLTTRNVWKDSGKIMFSNNLKKTPWLKRTDWDCQVHCTVACTRHLFKPHHDFIPVLFLISSTFASHCHTKGVLFGKLSMSGRFRCIEQFWKNK